MTCDDDDGDLECEGNGQFSNLDLEWELEE